MKNLKLLAWGAYIALILMVAACSDDNETAGPEKYTVTVTAADNGTAIAEPATCEAGETVTLTATPDEGFLFVKWTVISGEVTLADATANPVKITMPNSDAAIEASFAEALVPYAVKVVAGEHGSAKASVGEAEAEEATEGTSVTLTATPEEGYDFVAWTVTGVEIAAADLTKNPLTFVMPAGEVSAEASFKQQIDVLEMITDPTFKAYAEYRMKTPEIGEIAGESVTQLAWDTDKDGKLSEGEAAAVELFDLNTWYNGDGSSYNVIESLSGIEYFTGIKKLDISNYTLGSADMELNLTNCGELVELIAIDYGDAMLKITLGDKPELKSVDVEGSYGVTQIDFGGCTKLEKLTLESDYVEEINLGQCSQLKELALMMSELKSIDLSANAELIKLDVGKCGLTSLDISQQTKLTYLRCVGCELSEVDITKMAFNADNTYSAYVGSQGSGYFSTLELNELKMRADQKKHWDDKLANDSRNSRIKTVTVVD